MRYEVWDERYGVTYKVTTHLVPFGLGRTVGGFRVLLTTIFVFSPPFTNGSISVFSSSISLLVALSFFLFLCLFYLIFHATRSLNCLDRKTCLRQLLCCVLSCNESKSCKIEIRSPWYTSQSRSETGQLGFSLMDPGACL